MTNNKEILNKIIPNFEIELSLLKEHIADLKFYEKEKGKYYIKSHDSEEKEKLVYNENTGKSAPEEIVRQLFLFELTDNYGYPKNRIKTEESVSFGEEFTTLLKEIREDLEQTK